jgi:hypothetical protein
VQISVHRNAVVFRRARGLHWRGRTGPKSLRIYFCVSTMGSRLCQSSPMMNASLCTASSGRVRMVTCAKDWRIQPA